MSAKKKSASLIESYHLLAYDVVDSTNEEARRLAQGGASHGAVIWAKQQTRGKGRMGRPWISDEGNLFVSLLLQPKVPLADAAQFSFVTAVAVAEALQPVVAEVGALTLKWPNDILLNGRKLGGILLETEPTEDGKGFWLIVGVGINVETCPPDSEVLYPATCLKQAGIEIISAKIVLSRLLPHFVECYDRWIAAGFAPIREQWLALAHGVGEQTKVVSGKDEYSGVYLGIDALGRMQMTLADGTLMHLTSGDVLTQ
ncbi:MAG: biotin--[acetyl-CoA-carboxylase] ligase [Rickettsiales bacterium]|nr:biotin--[acetyl-CoA-carboxylase] ligase [Rickettsiales bacterium]